MNATATTAASSLQDHLSNLLQQRNAVDDLIGQVKAIDGEDGHWVFYTDDCFIRDPVPLIASLSWSPMNESDNTEDGIDFKSNAVVSVTDIFQRVAALRQRQFHANLQPNATDQLHKKLWFSLPFSSFPTLKPPSSKLESMKSELNSESVIVSISSFDGYSFSNEWSFVYKGSFSDVRSMEDTHIQLKKALKSLNVLYTEEQLEVNAKYILHRSLWQYQLSLENLLFNWQQHFPSIKGLKITRNLPVTHLRILLGRNPAKAVSLTSPVSFAIRLEDELIFTDNVQKELTEDTLVKYIYYHDLSLSPREMSFFSECMLCDRRNDTIDGLIGLNSDFRSFVDASNQSMRCFLVFPQMNISLRSLLREHSVSNTTGIDQSSNATDASFTQKIEDSLDMMSRPVHSSHASLAGELFGWGYDSYYSLGLGSVKRQLELGDERDEIFNPQPIGIPRSACIERVRMIACSSRHSLMLTHFGQIFACGDNADGALGCGDLVTRHEFAPVDWTVKNARSSESGDQSVPFVLPPKIVLVAAGSGVAGSHSLCIDEAGKLYAWGYGKATGLGTVQAVQKPTEVEFPPVIPNDLREAEEIKQIRIRDVSCGDCFSVCVSRCGKVFSWGQWTHGRLGLGPIPHAEGRRSGRRGGLFAFSARDGNSDVDKNNAKLAKYQLRPARVLHIESAVQVSCGEAHVLCKLSTGQVLAWGQNSLGQLGVGPDCSGLLRDAFRPVLLAHFGESPFQMASKSSQSDAVEVLSRWRKLMPKDVHKMYSDAMSASRKVKAKHVACGAFHSVVIDESGVPWTWGARGSPCLGHGDARLKSHEWSSRVNLLFSLSSTETSTMVPFELMQWCCQWSLPRVVESLRGHHIKQVTAGDLNTAFLSRLGRLFLCGSGPVVPAFDPPTLSLEEEMASTREKSMQPVEESVETTTGVVVTLPKCPSSSWMRELCTRTIKYVSGSGCRLFAILDEEIPSQELTTPLFRKLSSSRTVKSRRKHHFPESSDSSDSSDSANEQAGSDKDDSSLDSRFTDVSSRFNSLFESRGRADCLTIASGHFFLCHRALLAQRSAELRDIIFMESPTDGTDAVVQVLLPELHRDAARALFYYLYSDVLPHWALGDSSLLNSLVRCGKSLRMPRLSLLADRYLNLLSTKSTSDDSVFAIATEMPPTTLCKDLGSLVGDPEFSDVRFIAEGKAVLAHRFILETRSEYFRNMFASGMTAGSINHVIDVVVPDSFVGFLRLLIFIYTCTLPDGSDGALLEDIMAADRYGMRDMIVMCENMLLPTKENWLDLLRAAELVGSEPLKLSIKSFLKDNFDALQLDRLGFDDSTDVDDSSTSASSTTAALHALQNEFPQLLEEVLFARYVFSPAPPSHLLVAQVRESKELTIQAKQLRFPFWTLAVGAISLLLYQHVSTIVPLGFFVPALNIGGSLLFGYLLYRHVVKS